jgi:DNA-binding beta-propeller fold protein YncE
MFRSQQSIAGRYYCAFAVSSWLILALLPGHRVRAKEAVDPDAQRTEPITPERYDDLRVGQNDGNHFVVTTNQIVSPLGDQVGFTSRPTAVALSPDRRWLGVLGHNRVLLIDPDARNVAGSAAMSGSFTGIVFSNDSKELFASGLKGAIEAFAVRENGELKKSRSFALPAAKGKADYPAPAGLALDPVGKTLWAVLNLRNSVAEIDLKSGGLLRELPAGNAPYDLRCACGKIYVSNWAGRRPAAGDVTGPSGVAALVRVDPRTNIACEGSISVIDPAAGRTLKEIVVGPHASGLVVSPDRRYLCVANANADTVSVIETSRDAVVETIAVRPADGLLFGSAPNALAFSGDGKTLYVSNGTNNAVALVDFAPEASRLLGCLPAGWYPAGLAVDDQRKLLLVANIKGNGRQNTVAKGKRKVKGRVVWGFNTHDALGTVSLIPLSEAGKLPQHTETVLANNRLSAARRTQLEPRKDCPPRPVPERTGEPSPIKHVIYIIKENRTYDQVLGDMPQGEGNADLCIFGEEVTPNQHKLAREFVLLDNFYCNGVLSADGHQWTDEAYASDYLEKSFGSWPRSYPHDGLDAMAYAPSGFLWDSALARGKILRIYGEFVKGTVRWKDAARTPAPAFLDCYRDYLAGSNEIEVRGTAAIKTIEPYICPTTVGFPLTVSDQYRAAQFLREFREFERKGEMPNLLILALPADHTSGTTPGCPMPEASVADNDLALGHIVEAVSRSRFWPETCIFVVEDDPQNGFDHIDAHRTLAQVISPYSRRHGVDSTNYNQTSMVRTIEQMLGLAPMNQIDAAATPMASCFSIDPDLVPYVAVKNNIPLDRLNPNVSAIKDIHQRHWAEVSLKLPLANVDQADEDTLNRILWHARRGRDDTYPDWAQSETDDDEGDGVPSR